MRKKILKFAIFVLLLAGILYACQRDEDDPDVNQQFTVDEARAWYEAHKPDYIELKSGGNEKKVKYVKPDWSRAIRTETENEEVVETDIMTNGGFGFVNEEMYNEWKKSGNMNYLRTHTRLVIIKNKKDKTEKCFFMTISGERGYVEKKNFYVEKNTYRNPEKDFSGMILFHNPDGSFSNGWKYTEGKLTYTVTIDIAGLPGLQLKSAYCQTTTFYFWETTCTTHYYVGSVDGVVQNTTYSYRTCTSVLVYSGSSTFCVNIDDGGGGNSYPPGGYTGPTTTTQPTTLNEDLKKLFVGGTIDLTSDDINSLNIAFDEMSRDCMMKSITSYLKNNNISLNSISINENQLQPAMYNGIGNLVFAGNWAIDNKNLRHEWFHVGQKKMSGTDLKDGYAEFENWLFWDIKETIRLGGNFNTYTNHDFACYTADMEIYKYEYQAWLNFLTNGGTSFPSLSNLQTQGFYRFGPIFAKEVRTMYSFLNFPTGNTYVPKTSSTLFNNCNFY